MESISDRVRKLRVERGFSQAELARMVGIKQPSLADIENARTKKPSGETLLKLAAALKVAPVYLQTGRGEMVAQQQGVRAAIIKAMEPLTEQELTEVLNFAVSKSPTMRNMLQRMVQHAQELSGHPADVNDPANNLQGFDKRSADSLNGIPLQRRIGRKSK